MAETTAETVTELPQAFVHYAPSVEVDQVVSTGDTLSVDGRTLTVDDLVGHATGEILFAYESDGDRSAIVGDNVLPHITPNPFLQPPPESGGERPRVLPQYNESFGDLRTGGFDRLLPGHREVIDRPADRIDEILEAHRERTEIIAGLLDDPTTPVEIMRGLFEDLPVTEQFTGMSEVVGHLDVLEARDRVTGREIDVTLRYELNG